MATDATHEVRQEEPLRFRQTKFDSISKATNELSYAESNSYCARRKRRFPIRTGLAALGLFTVGSLLIYASTVIGLDEDRRGLSLFILGLVTFVPGSYATVQLYGSYKGWRGYDYSQVPSYDD